ncbi:hypothetical protein EDD64_1321 [Effusibacillus lacus]|nr:hypothetical protein EDD64_1321 [Effusibacillus lacus]
MTIRRKPVIVVLLSYILAFAAFVYFSHPKHAPQVKFSAWQSYLPNQTYMDSYPEVYGRSKPKTTLHRYSPNFIRTPVVGTYPRSWELVPR